MQEFLANAPNGFVYVSLGTNVDILSFPRHIQNAFIDVFTKLPYKVVFKLNGKIANKTDNIYIAPWFPQQSILGKTINIKKQLKVAIKFLIKNVTYVKHIYL